MDSPKLATMSDEGEKTCPLCAENMDLTDQQLKPCKCGYEICVWCWHHIMEMAEKDDTEGRCPACRSPYDKKKIVGMAAKCERMMAEVNMERKMKSQKLKTKTAEAKKQQLSSVRVIQRNLVYIVGLPPNLGDEDLLQRKEYFGQYGKVLKVSMSRTAAGVVQQFPNNTCSVYITYSKEEEAIRCIQSVHGFVLEGKSLKACFGTTKYCHAWLRNVPCTNPECLYLHEVGSQEDSFTKDEIISAYTRSRVQQITSTTNNLQRRYGNVLPLPFDDYSHSTSSTAKPTVKDASNNTPSISKDSTPKSVALPAAASWGMRSSNQQPLSTSASSNGPSKKKSDSVGSALAFSSADANSTSASTLHVDVVKKPISHEDSQISCSKSKSDVSQPSRQLVGSEMPPTPNGGPASVSLSRHASSPPLSKYTDKGLNLQTNVLNSLDASGNFCVQVPEKEENITADVQIQDLSSDMSEMSIDRKAMNKHSGVVRANIELPDHGMLKSSRNQGLEQNNAGQCREPLLSSGIGKCTTSTKDIFVSSELFDWRRDPPIQAVPNASLEEEEDVLFFDSQRLKDPEVVCHSTYLPKSENTLYVSNHSRSHSFQQRDPFTTMNLNADPQFVDNISDGSRLHSSSISSISNGYPEKLAGSSGRTVENAFLLSNESQGQSRGRLQSDADKDAAMNTGENIIISNMLSMDFDTWDDPLALPQNLAKLLNEPEKEPSSLKMSNSWKGHNNNQSRFSFARQEKSGGQASDLERSFSGFSQLPKSHSLSQNFSGNRDPLLDKLGIRNGYHPGSFEEPDKFSNNPSVFSPNKLSGAARSQISAPPGFSVPSRAPPPGFTSHERVDQSSDTMSGNHLPDSSSLLRNTYQTQPIGNTGSTADIEFMDPAILAVGKGRLQNGLSNSALDPRNNLPAQLNAYENEARLQLMVEKSISPHQNLRYANFGNSFSSLTDSYGISSRLMDQPQANNLSSLSQFSLQQSRNPLISNGGHWDGWNEVQGGNNLGMAELLRNERLMGFNKFYNGYEDSKFRMPSSGDLFNRTFGM